MAIHYEVSSRPSPEYESGNYSGRCGIYSVVKMDGDTILGVVETFDLADSAKSNLLAYQRARELNETRKS